MRLPRVQVIFAIALVASALWAVSLTPHASSSPMTGRLPLLAVSVGPNGTEGSGGVAYMDLRVVNGSGNVYIHTDPFTKVDTQASTTFAERYACSIAKVDCSHHDFLYSIESEAPIVGGPSAGAATAALTYAVLTHQRVPQDVAVTGTITSGGIVGNVGGVPQKVAAAQAKGLKKVVIPTFSNFSAQNTTIQVERATTLNQVIAAMGLQGPAVGNDTIEVPQSYTTTMKRVAAELCAPLPLPDLVNRTSDARLAYSRITNLSANASAAAARGAYYTQASYCFNKRVQEYYLELLNATRGLDDTRAAAYAIDAVQRNLSFERSSFSSFQRNTSKPDLNDIQIYSIVQERYEESSRLGRQLLASIPNSTQSRGFRTDFDSNTLYSLAYMHARIDSMTSWMSFAGLQSGPAIPTSDLRTACIKKLSDASEQAEYTAYLTGLNTLDTTSITDAYNSGDYAVCVYQASLLTAQAETFLSTIGVNETDLPTLFSAKSQAAHEAIASETAQGRFPIMAYSYYEYAQSLEASNPQTAMLYAEDALQLAELDLYLGNPGYARLAFTQRNLLPFALGLFVMAALGFVLTASGWQAKTRRRKPKRRTNR